MKLLIVILFLCICLAVKTILLFVYLASSAWMGSQPKMIRGLNIRRGKFVIRPFECLFRVPYTRMNAFYVGLMAYVLSRIFLFGSTVAFYR